MPIASRQFVVHVIVGLAHVTEPDMPHPLGLVNLKRASPRTRPRQKRSLSTGIDAPVRHGVPMRLEFVGRGKGGGAAGAPPY